MAIDNISRELVYKSKKEAKEYDLIYQCTSFSSFKNILKTKEIWLSNLKELNDKQEVRTVTRPEFENFYFVASFTYDNNISEKDWMEYGRSEDSILFGFKRDWVKREGYLMSGSSYYNKVPNGKIYKNFDEMNIIRLRNECNGNIIFPYYFQDFGFYKVVYDNTLYLKMEEMVDWSIDDFFSLNGRIIDFALPGIIKQKRGICKRDEKEYSKKWEEEKEIRLKATIRTSYYNNETKIFHYPKIAVKLNENAFDKIVLKFNPKLDEERVNNYKLEIKNLKPNSEIIII